MKLFLRFECDCGIKEEIELQKEDEDDWYDVDMNYSINNKMKNFISDIAEEYSVITCICGKRIELGQ